LMNEIANLAIITGETNIKISDKEPAKYFPDVEQKYPSALVNQLIPKTPNLWVADSFLDFLKARRGLLATEINQFLGQYWKDKICDTSVQGAFHLWSMPESEVLEFKETWQFDVVQSEREAKTVKNSKLQLACVKTIAGFMNSLGGDLLIGVSDNNLVEGLGRDVKIFSKSFDKLEGNINQILTNSLGISKASYYSTKILEIDGKSICHIQVKANRSSKTWVKFGGEEYFFVRSGNGTKRLSGEEADQYWIERLNI